MTKMMDTRLVALYEATRALHETAYRTIQALREKLQRCDDLAELADTAYALNEVAKYASDTRRDCEGLSELVQKQACAIAIRDQHMGVIRTEYCRATTKIKQVATLPRKKSDPENFAKLMAALGIDERLVEMEVVRVHWPGFTEYLSDLAAQGKPLPEGVDPSKTYPKYSLIIMGKKGVNE